MVISGSYRSRRRSPWIGPVLYRPGGCRTTKPSVDSTDELCQRGPGDLTLRNLTTRGQVLLAAEDQVRSGHVQAENVRVLAADVRGRSRRPHGFGVEALQGGSTLWSRQADPAVELTAELLDIAAGSAEELVRGSGIFVGGPR